MLIVLKITIAKKKLLKSKIFAAQQILTNTYLGLILAFNHDSKKSTFFRFIISASYLVSLFNKLINEHFFIEKAARKCALLILQLSKNKSTK